MAKAPRPAPGPGRTAPLTKAALLASPLAALDAAFSAQEPIKSPIGGQAVLEGVMMRGDDLWTVAVRTPQGEIKSRSTPHKAWSKRRKFFGLPLVRGPVVLIDSLVVGLKALNFSAEEAAAAEIAAAETAKQAKTAETPETSDTAETENHKTAAAADAEAPNAAKRTEIADIPEAANIAPRLENSPEASKPALFEPSPTDLAPANPDNARAPKNKPALGNLALAFSMIAGIALAMVLFVALPHVLSLLLGQAAGYDERGVLFHLIDGIFKFIILILYIHAIGLMSEIGRLYAYHGAEHKAIHVFEAKLPLTPEAAKPFPTWHPRCGTAFLFLVLALSVLFFAMIFPILFRFDHLGRVQAALAGVGIKIVLMLPLAALAYELTRLASRHEGNRILAAMIWPGLLLQRLTTREPDLSQLEVAIHSLKSVLSASKAGPMAEATNGH